MMKTPILLEAWMVLLVARGALDESDVEFIRGNIRAACEEAWNEGYQAHQNDLGAADTTPNPYAKKEKPNG
jgi:hypothetical protein